tara:strand:- start:56524 stop:56697 length:174 start_codon:yes stop_codon:yes gene_type:complete
MSTNKKRKRITGGTTTEDRLFPIAIKAQDAENIPSMVDDSSDTNYFDDREDYLNSLY